MLMRPAPPNATGPSPRITTTFHDQTTTLLRVHSGLRQSPRVENGIATPNPFDNLVGKSASTHSFVSVGQPSDLLPILYTDKPQELQAQFHNDRALAVSVTVTCDNCRTDHRSAARSRHGQQPDRLPIHRRSGEANGKTPRGNTRNREAEVTPSDNNRGDFSRIPQVLDRVPYHAAFADDPAFHRPDQGVVADDNTENHRRRAPPPSDNFGHYKSEESEYNVQRLPDITGPSAIDTADTTVRRIHGGPHRQRRQTDNNATSIHNKNHVQATEEKEVPESRWISSAKNESDFNLVQKGSSREDAAIGMLGQHGSVHVTQVPQVTKSEHRLEFRKREIRSRIDDKTCSLVFVFYLLALPILCATSGSPPGPDRGSPLAFPHNNNSHRNSSARVPGMSSEPGDHHPYRDYTWEVNQINPWLSACDLAGPAPADLQGSCGPPETPKNCPDACRKPDARASRAADSFFAVVSQAIGYDGGRGVPRPETGGRAAPEQCLFYLEESHKTEICRDDFGKESSERFPTVRENRYRFLSGLRLRHCCEHAALNALASGEGGPLEEVLGGNDGCKKAIGKLLAVDALAARLHCEFGEVLARYDCGQPYSVIYNCSHCKEAYRRWVCSSLVPYFAHDDQPRQNNQGLAGTQMGTGMRIRPCRSFCQTVEQRCPYLLPGDRAPAYPTQYAGEPTFLCRDPNIPETGEQASRALHADEECCFHVCSDDDPGLGVCANCTEPDLEVAIRGGDARRDPSTAPQCELSSPSSINSGQQHQSTSSGTSWSDTTSSGSSTTEPLNHLNGLVHGDVTSGTSHQSSSSSSSSSPSSRNIGASSFCGSGRVGTISSSGASSHRVYPLPVTMCAYLAWGALIGLCTIKVLTSYWTTNESSLLYPELRLSSCNESVIRDKNNNNNNNNININNNNDNINNSNNDDNNNNCRGIIRHRYGGRFHHSRRRRRGGGRRRRRRRRRRRFNIDLHQGCELNKENKTTIYLMKLNFSIIKSFLLIIYVYEFLCRLCYYDLLNIKLNCIYNDDNNNNNNYNINNNNNINNDNNNKNNSIKLLIKHDVEYRDSLKNYYNPSLRQPRIRGCQKRPRKKKKKKKNTVTYKRKRKRERASISVYIAL